jgi:hypothetical protein
MAKFEKIIVDVQAVSLAELIGINFPELFGISHLRKRSSTQENRRTEALSAHMCQISPKEFGQIIPKVSVEFPNQLF